MGRGKSKMKIDYPGDLRKVEKTPRLKISDAKTGEDVRAYLEQEGLIGSNGEALQQSQPASIHYTEGDILSKYDLGEVIADTENGGQGTVIRAKRKEDNTDVVVKIYSAKETGDWDKILHEEKRAGREIRFLERANRDNVSGLPILVEY